MQAVRNLKKFVFDTLSDNTGAWCGARVLIMAGGGELIVRFGTSSMTASDLCQGLALLATAYAGKDWSERR
jgi:hypothetical protein